MSLFLLNFILIKKQDFLFSFKTFLKTRVEGGIKLFSLRNFKLLQNAMNFAKLCFDEYEWMIHLPFLD